MSEHFEASGLPAIEECLRRVDDCDVVVSLVAHRYGWIPDSASNKSITWLECERARERGKPLIALLVDEDSDWPEGLKESAALTGAVQDGSATPELLNEVQLRIKKLKEFRDWLTENRVAGFFEDERDVEKLLLHALHQWRLENRPDAASTSTLVDIGPYLEYVLEQTQYVVVRGLTTGAGQEVRFPIEDLFIPMQTDFPAPTRRDRSPWTRPSSAHGESALEESLSARRLVILGEPGSGKTTFLRWVAYNLALSALRREPNAARKRLGLESELLPILIRVVELEAHFASCRDTEEGPAGADDPGWLPHFLGTLGRVHAWRLPRRFWHEQLESGGVMVLLDGLDEARDRQRRTQLARFLDNSVRAYPTCRFVVTTRSHAYGGQVQLSSFNEALIEPLESDAIHEFLERWCRALYPKDPGAGEQYFAALVRALNARAEIRRMARFPVMLTALAVVHWNEGRVPEQRAELYELIIRWLLRARSERAGLSSPEVRGERLQAMALAMQCGPKGRMVLIRLRDAAHAIRHLFKKQSLSASLQSAERFLEEESSDGGIVSGLGSELRFWHLTFQDYLAARALSGLAAVSEQMGVLLHDDRLYKWEWRETVLLFAGVLRAQGTPKVDRFVDAIVDQLPNGGDLSSQARVVGLIGSIVRELSPRGYEPADPRYSQMIRRVYGIFAADQAYSVSLQEKIEAADALGRAGDHRFSDSTSMWIRFEAGTFWMGAQSANPAAQNYDPRADDDAESPVHPVALSAFELARFPVTVSEYDEFIVRAGHAAPENWAEQREHPTRPVVDVSWNDAVQYCGWLSGEQGRNVRLPTEAEWEFAARGGTDLMYPWGPEAPDDRRANYRRLIRHPSPVGLFPAGTTRDGVVDLAGNVFEWCQDHFATYSSRPLDDPHGAETGSRQVLRGGSWDSDADALRASHRAAGRPDERLSQIGFRCAREVVA